MNLPALFLLSVVVFALLTNAECNKVAEKHRNKAKGRARVRVGVSGGVSLNDGVNGSVAHDEKESYYQPYTLPSFDPKFDNATGRVAYNATHEYIATYNNKDQATVTSTNGTLTGIYNTTSKVLICIDTKTNKVRLVENAEEFETLDWTTDAGIKTAFSVLYDLLVAEGEKEFKWEGSFNVGGGFNVGGSIGAIVGSLFNGPRAFLDGIVRGFGGLFGNIGNYVNAGTSGIGGLIAAGFNAASGIVSSLSGIFNFITYVQTVPLRFINTLGQVFLGQAGSVGNGLKALANLIALAGGAAGNVAKLITQPLSAFFNITSGLVNFNGIEVPLVTLFNDTDWVVKIGDSYNGTVKLTIRYKGDTNLLSFYNGKLGIAVAFSGNSGVYAISNTTDGSTLIVSQKTGDAKYTDYKSAEIVATFKALNYKAGFTLIANVIENKSNGINNFLNFDRSVFSIRNLLRFQGLPFFNNNLLFILNRDLGDKVFASFGEFFEAAKSSPSLNPLAILSAVLGDNVIAKSFGSLLNSIFDTLNGRFNLNLIGGAITAFEDSFNGAGQLGANVFGSVIDVINNIFKTVGGSIDGALKLIVKAFPIPVVTFGISVQSPQ